MTSTSVALASSTRWTASKLNRLCGARFVPLCVDNGQGHFRLPVAIALAKLVCTGCGRAADIRNLAVDATVQYGGHFIEVPILVRNRPVDFDACQAGLLISESSNRLMTGLVSGSDSSVVNVTVSPVSETSPVSAIARNS